MDEFPERTKADALHDGARIVLNLLPGLGGALAALLDAVLEAPLSKRRAEYLRSAGERIQSLLEKDEALTPESLSKNDMFVTAVVQAAQIALRTHQEEKLKLLLNAVESAATAAIDEDIQQMFLRFIDELTPTHLRVLKYLQDPKAWHEQHPQKTRSVSMSTQGEMEKAMPELRGRGMIVDLVYRDLVARGLLRSGLSLATTTLNPWAPLTSDLGNAFLGYIHPPQS